jgi:hypothetical protein
MDDYFKQLSEELKKQLQEKIAQHQTDVVKSQQYQQELKYLGDFSYDAVQTIRTISFYSTRAKHIYDDFLTITSSDDLLQSIVGLRELVVNGIHNMAKREIRYLIEMTTKYLIVDQEKMGQPLSVKTQYLADNIPNSSIEVIDRLSTPFDATLDKQFKDEVKDLFYKACAYVHPSKRQIEEQIDNYSKGVHIGFETAKMLSDINKLLFRSYDIILTMLFIGFGQSMSSDLFIEIYDTEPKWKFHKGKYVKEYSKLFEYKLERQKNNR